MDLGKKTQSYLLVHYVLFIFLVLAFSRPGLAQIIPQTDQGEEEVTKPSYPSDSLGRRTPRGTVYGFINAVAQQNYRRASYFFDLDQTATGYAEAESLVQDMQRMLDAGGNMNPYAGISDDFNGNTNDELPIGVDRVGSINVQGERFDLLLEQTEGPEGPIWLFSDETVEAIASHSIEDELLIEQFSPEVLEDNNLGGVAISHWLALLLIAAGAYLVSWVIIWGILFLIPRLWKKARSEPTKGVIKSLSLPIKLYLAVWLFVAFTERVGISIVLRQRFSGITIVIGIIAFLILLWQLSDFLSKFSEKRMTMRGNVSGVSVILFLRRAAKIAIVVFGVIAILGIFGVDVTTGLAALGIGGIALALGAQKTVENFVGSVTLVVDQPVRVGDFCQVGDTVGTVEKIGMRSTRIRTLERTIVTIPNGKFSSERIENYAHRDRFLFQTVLGLRYETTPDQIRFLLAEIRAILYSHPMVSPDPARIRFLGLGADSLNMEIFSYILAANFDEYLEVKEDLLLMIMDKVDESGTDFAFPSQTVYFGRDKGLSQEKSEKAIQKVKEWREKEEMPIPNFDPERIRSMKNSIPYPPEGSARRKEQK